MAMPSSQSPRQNHERDVVQEWPRRPGLKNDRFTSERRSIARRIFSSLVHFIIAVLIGVGAVLAWQSHGDDAKELVRTSAPSLGWLLPVSTTKSPPLAATLAQQLEPITLNLALMRRSVEQLAAKQEQMAQDIATLQTVQQDIKQNEYGIMQKMSSPPPSRAAPPRKPPQPTAPSSAVQSPPPAGSPLR